MVKKERKIMKKVFFIGDVALDEYYQADYFPKIKEKIIVHSLPPQMGGSMANAAVVFQTLGNQTQFFTALNSGAITQKLMKGLQEEGINTEHMVFDESIPDAKCIIILAEDEHTVFIPTLALQRIDIREETFKALCECDYIYTNFCEILPVKYNGMDAKAVLEALRKENTKIWCDADCAELSDKEAELFSYIDVVFVNEMGEVNLEKRYGKDWKDTLFDKGLSLIIVTRAEGGCSLYEKNKEEISVPGVHVTVKDVTGAGDTFGSSFLHAYMRSEDLGLCAEFANYVAARAVTGIGARYGAAQPEEISRFIEEHKGDIEKFKVFL